MGNRSRTPVALGVLVLALCALVAASGDGLERTAVGRDSSAEESAGERDDVRDRDEDTRPADESGKEESTIRRAPAVWLSPERLIPLVLLALLLAIALAVLSQLRLVVLRRQLQGDRWRAPVRMPPAPQRPEDEDDVERLMEAVDAGLEELDARAPRNTIVAAWLRLERAAESGRFRRDPADTPSEFAERVLSSYSLDAGALDRLAALYREARFSEHPIREPQREEARSCLAALLADLRASTSGPGSPR